MTDGACILGVCEVEIPFSYNNDSLGSSSMFAMRAYRLAETQKLELGCPHSIGEKSPPVTAAARLVNQARIFQHQQSPTNQRQTDVLYTITFMNRRAQPSCPSNVHESLL